MRYTQDCLRESFPVYDPADVHFAAWLQGDFVARAAWLSMNSMLRASLQAAALALLNSGKSSEE